MKSLLRYRHSFVTNNDSFLLLPFLRQAIYSQKFYSDLYFLIRILPSRLGDDHFSAVGGESPPQFLGLQRHTRLLLRLLLSRLLLLRRRLLLLLLLHLLLLLRRAYQRGRHCGRTLLLQHFESACICDSSSAAAAAAAAAAVHWYGRALKQRLFRKSWTSVLCKAYVYARRTSKNPPPLPPVPARPPPIAPPLPLCRQQQQQQ